MGGFTRMADAASQQFGCHPAAEANRACPEQFAARVRLDRAVVSGHTSALMRERGHGEGLTDDLTAEQHKS